MTVRREILKSPSETGAWSRETGRRPWNRTLTDRAASLPAGIPWNQHASLSQRRIHDCSRSVHE